MNKNFFIHQVTIYHFNDEETFVTNHISQVYFRHNKKVNLIDKGLEKGSTGTIIIPTTDKISISNEDYVIEGNITDEFDLIKLIKKYQVYKVVSIDDNRKGKLPHYKIGVSE